VFVDGAIVLLAVTTIRVKRHKKGEGLRQIDEDLYCPSRDFFCPEFIRVPPM
jgi:hypothetical protein